MMEFLILMPVLMRHHYCEIYISNDEHLRHKYNLPAISYRKGKVLRVKEPLQGNYRPGKLRGQEHINDEDLDKTPTEGEKKGYVLLENNPNTTKNFTRINFTMLTY